MSRERFITVIGALALAGCEDLYGGLRSDNPYHCKNSGCPDGQTCQSSGRCGAGIAEDAGAADAESSEPVMVATPDPAISGALIGVYSPVRGTAYIAAAHTSIWRWQPEQGAPVAIHEPLRQLGVDTAKGVSLTSLCGAPDALAVTTGEGDAATLKLPSGPAARIIPAPSAVEPVNACWWGPGAALTTSLWLVGSKIYRYVEKQPLEIKLLGELGVKSATVLNAVWGASPNNIWMGGDNGVMVHVEGLKVVEVAGPGTKALRGVHGTLNTTWFVGDNGVAWRVQPVPLVAAALGAARLNGVWAVSDQEVWAAGVAGTVLRYSGGAWRRVTVRGGRGKDLRAITGNPSGELWAVGVDGEILRYAP